MYVWIYHIPTSFLHRNESQFVFWCFLTTTWPNSAKYAYWLLGHSAKASWDGVSTRNLSGSSGDLGYKINIIKLLNPYWNLEAEWYSSTSKPYPHSDFLEQRAHCIAQTAQSICGDTAPLWDVQLQWHRRSHGSEKYSSAGLGGSSWFIILWDGFAKFQPPAEEE